MEQVEKTLKVIDFQLRVARQALHRDRNHSGRMARNWRDVDTLLDNRLKAMDQLVCLSYEPA